MCSVFATKELKGLRCRKLFSSSIYALPAISGSVRPYFYINNCLRKFMNGVCQKILAPPTLKNNREPCLRIWLRLMNQWIFSIIWNVFSVVECHIFLPTTNDCRTYFWSKIQSFQSQKFSWIYMNSTSRHVYNTNKSLI
jgi:hypothetical protein